MSGSGNSAQQNRMTRNAKIITAFLVLLFILTGFFREFVFLNVNEQMRVTYYSSPDNFVAPSMQWLSSISYTSLYYFKWILTAVFILIFAGLTAVIVKLIFQDKKLIRISVITYLAIFSASFLFYLIGALSGNTETTYTIARFLAGLAESPALLIILVGAFTIIRRN